MREKVQKLIKRFKEFQGDPASIARGVVIGTFLGFAPLLPSLVYWQSYSSRACKLGGS